MCFTHLRAVDDLMQPPFTCTAHIRLKRELLLSTPDRFEALLCLDSEGIPILNRDADLKWAGQQVLGGR
jgi:hypothetical protein